MEIERDKERTTLAMAFARMWQDANYKQEFLSDPKAALSREGVNFSGNTSVRVVEETPTIKYVDLENTDPQETLQRLLPIPEGQEVRFVQSTSSLRYLILPARPGWIAPGTQSTGNLLNAQTKETSVEAVIDSQAVAVQAISVSPIVEQSIEQQAMELVVAEVESQELVVMDSQAIEVAQVEIETSVSAVVEMA